MLIFSLRDLNDNEHSINSYVKLYLVSERGKDTERKTKVIKDNCDPTFQET